MTARILVVDDDPQIADEVRIALSHAGRGMDVVTDGAVALERVKAQMPDLVVADIGLPEMVGRDLCRRIRRRSGSVAQTPVIFLTAEEDEIDRVVGLELGADDYVVKPFSPRDLTARIGAILKRSGPAPVPADGALTRGCLSLLPVQHECREAGRAVPLTAREMELLARLMARPDQVISRPQPVDAIYGTIVHVSDRTTDSHLRAKLGAAGRADAVDTVHGAGSRMGACTAPGQGPVDSG